MSRQSIFWDEAEQQLVSAEGVRLWQAGKVSGIAEAFRKAQSVLPKNRRRVISTTSKVPWFSAAIKGAAAAPDAPQSAEQQHVANTYAPTESIAPQPGSDHRKNPRIVWTKDERRVLCVEAARLIHGLDAGSPRDALIKAQAVLPPGRRRHKIYTMTSVADWYPAGLQAAHIALRKQLDKQAREEVGAQLARAQEAAKPAEPEQQAAPPAVVEPVPVATMPTVTSSSTGLATMFGTPWHQLRTHIVQEIASMVAEGIQLGLASVQLTAPKADDQEPARHVPFVRDGAKPRPPSVLIVGLRGGQVPQIEADFGTTLDLRFCSADKSKDQLRAMTEQAETTVAVVDFISHSHTDIIKSRARHYIESNGGMTHLRQQLAHIAGVPVNGHAQAAA